MKQTIEFADQIIKFGPQEVIVSVIAHVLSKNREHTESGMWKAVNFDTPIIMRDGLSSNVSLTAQEIEMVKRALFEWYENHAEYHGQILALDEANARPPRWLEPNRIITATN